MAIRRSFQLSVALFAVLLLPGFTTAASGNKLTISNQRIRAVWTTMTFASKTGGFPIACAVTMEGSFHSRTIAKVRRALIGYISRAALTRPCAGGEVWIHNGTEAPLGVATPTSLPWHVRYTGFTGTLPALTGVFVDITGMTATVSVSLCLAVYGGPTEIERTWFFTLNGAGTVTSFEPEPEHLIRPVGSPLACPNPGRISGGSTVTLLGNTSTIFIRLI